MEKTLRLSLFPYKFNGENLKGVPTLVSYGLRFRAWTY
jgi:hypothetical protein